MYFNIYGCGFAGLVSALGLCNNQIKVNAIDIDHNKVKQLNNNDLTLVPKKLQSDFQKHNGHQLSFYLTGQEPPAAAAHLLTLPTPIVNQDLDLQTLKNCIAHIHSHNKTQHQKFIIIRSTLPLNGMQDLQNYTEKTFPEFKTQFFYIPEFMREGTGLNDWREPPLSVIGLANPLHPVPGFIKALFKHTYLRPMQYNEAISVKLLSNAFHAMKVSFANEALRLCNDNNISAHKVMSEFCLDTKLNISKKYLKPGFAWGGSCLGKDTQSLANQREDLPLLKAIISSNKVHIQYLKSKILNYNKPNISVVGLSFKDNVNDYRDSPTVELIKEILTEDTIKTVSILDAHIDALDVFNNNKKIQKLNSIQDINSTDLVLIKNKQNAPHLQHTNIIEI